MPKNMKNQDAVKKQETKKTPPEKSKKTPISKINESGLERMKLLLKAEKESNPEKSKKIKTKS